jgi:hypothetical protein
LLSSPQIIATTNSVAPITIHMSLILKIGKLKLNSLKLKEGEWQYIKASDII